MSRCLSFPRCSDDCSDDPRNRKPLGFLLRLGQLYPHEAGIISWPKLGKRNNTRCRMTETMFPGSVDDKDGAGRHS